VTLTIGKIASLSKVSADTLRYYEREGLISPAGKSEGGYRLYDRDAVRRVTRADHWTIARYWRRLKNED